MTSRWKSCALGLVLLLGGCFPHCPPQTPANLGVNTQLRQFRLSGIFVDAASPAGRGNGDIANDYAMPGHERGALLQAVSQTLQSAFKHVGDAGYAEAPAVSVRCVVDELQAGHSISFYHSAAKFAATFTLSDPTSGEKLFEKRYAEEFDGANFSTDSECINSSLGFNYFQTALRKVLMQLAVDAAGVAAHHPLPRQAPIEGTLEVVDGQVSKTLANIATFAWEVRNSVHSHNLPMMERLAAVEVPNHIQAAVDREKLFSTGPGAIYRITVYITKRVYGSRGLFSGDYVQYEADTVVFRNDEEVGDVRFVSQKVSRDALPAEVERQAQGVIDLIKTNAKAWNNTKDG